MKVIFTADGPAPSEAELSYLETAAYKLALGMEEGTTRRSFEVVGGVNAYLVAGSPGNVHIHTTNDSKSAELTFTIADYPNSFGAQFTPPDFVAGFVQGDGRCKQAEDSETGCIVPQLLVPPTIHTEYVSQDFASKKLTVTDAHIYVMSEYPPNDNPEKNLYFAQAARKRPGLFTGHMATLVQLLLGAGRFLSPSVYKQASMTKKVKNPISGMQLATDPRVRKVDEPPNPSHFQYMKPFGKGVCAGTDVTYDPFAMEVPWDYRWGRTHGVVFGQDLDSKAPGVSSVGFIVDISSIGVYAYPIEVDPITKYTKVQRYMARVYPWLDEPVFDGKTVFEAFGGIPLPTYFKRSELDLAVTKDKAVRLGDMSDFYPSGEFISTMFGWAFSKHGEAANITVKNDGTDGMKTANLYKAKFIGLRVGTETVDGKKKRVVNGAMSSHRVRGGNIYHPGRPPRANPCATTGAPQFHIYEPVISEVTSYDFWYGRRGTGKEKCDAPIFCCYIENDLHLLHYVYNPAQVGADTTQDTREECQVTGTWTTTTVVGAITAGHFYNSTMDLRRTIASYTNTTVVKEWPAYDFDIHSQADIFSILCVSWHYYYNHHREDYVSSGTEGWAANVGTSSTDRSVYFACTLYTKANGSKGYGQGITYAGAGPEVKYCAMYHFITHWAGGTGGLPITVGCTEPLDDYTEIIDSCHSGGTESLVGKVKNFTVTASGEESCGFYAGQKTGGHYTAKGMLGTWFALGDYKKGKSPAENFPDPYLDHFELTGGHEVQKKVYIFGSPLANGRLLVDQKDTANADEEAFGLEYAYEWFKWSLPECPATPMPVCQNFYGKDFLCTYNDRGWGEVRKFGDANGLNPNSIPVGGIT